MDLMKEPITYIILSIKTNLSKMVRFDNSFAKMRLEERKNLVETINIDEVIVVEEVRGTKENFILRNNNIRNANAKPIMNNPVSNVLNRNMFKRLLD